MSICAVVLTARTVSRHLLETFLSSSLRPSLSPTCSLLSTAVSKSNSQTSQCCGNRSGGGSGDMNPVCWSISNTSATVEILARELDCCTSAMQKQRDKTAYDLYRSGLSRYHHRKHPRLINFQYYVQPIQGSSERATDPLGIKHSFRHQDEPSRLKFLETSICNIREPGQQYPKTVMGRFIT